MKKNEFFFFLKGVVPDGYNHIAAAVKEAVNATYGGFFFFFFLPPL